MVVSASAPSGKLLIIGASHGLGHGIAKEYLERGWDVVGTVFEEDRTMLHDLADAFGGRVRIEHVDIRDGDHIVALRERLTGESFDYLFVNSGVTNNPAETPGEVSTSEFIRLMLTNALGPMRVIEFLEDLISPTGTIGVMSSGQGSVTNNETGGSDVYRSSKAALNMFMRSYAARHAGESRSLLVLAPGWTRTHLGGEGAPVSIEQTIPDIVDVMLSAQGKPGLRYLDNHGAAVPW